MNDIAKSHRLRIGRHSQPGQIYLVTTVTRHRQQIFRSLSNARVLINTLREGDARDRTRTLAFVVMPDHLHWLFELGQVASLPVVVKAVKSVSSHRLGRSVWQAGFS